MHYTFPHDAPDADRGRAGGRSIAAARPRGQAAWAISQPIEATCLDATGRFMAVPADEAGRYHSAVLPGLWFDPRWFEREPLPNAERLMLDIAPDAYLNWIEALRRGNGRNDGGS